MLRKILVSVALFVASGAVSNAQIYDYLYKGRTTHVGLQMDLNNNFGKGNMDKDGTKPAFAPFLRAGGYLRHNLNNNLYFNFGLTFGNGNFSYKYVQTFEPTSDTTFPKGILEKRSISMKMMEPGIAVGYLLQFSEKHQIDLRFGASIPVYLRRYNNLYPRTISKVTLMGNNKMEYATSDGFQTRVTGNQWGVVNTNFYLGYKRIHYNDLNDRLGIGLLIGYTVYDKGSGVADYNAYNTTYSYPLWERSHKLTYLSFGVRLEYDLF